MSDIYTPGISRETALWEKLTIKLLTANAVAITDAGEKFENTKNPFRFIYIHRVDRQVDIYAESFYLGTFEPGEKLGIELPSPCNNVVVKWAESPVQRGGTTTPPIAEIWIASQPIFVMHSQDMGENLFYRKDWNPLGIVWNPLEFNLPTEPNDAMTVVTVPTLMDTSLSGNGFFPWGNATYPNPPIRFVSAESLFSVLEPEGGNLVRGNIRALADSYSVLFRGGSPNGSVGLVFAAPGSLAFATIWRSADRDVRIRRIEFALKNVSAAVELAVFLTTTTGEPTGGGVLTADRHDTSSPVSSVVCRAAPTGGYVDSGERFGSTYYALGITGAASVINPPPPINWVSLYDDTVIDSLAPMILRAGEGRGMMILITASAALTMRGYARVHLTEV